MSPIPQEGPRGSPIRLLVGSSMSSDLPQPFDAAVTRLEKRLDLVRMYLRYTDRLMEAGIRSPSYEEAVAFEVSGKKQVGQTGVVTWLSNDLTRRELEELVRLERDAVYANEPKEEVEALWSRSRGRQFIRGALGRLGSDR